MGAGGKNVADATPELKLCSSVQRLECPALPSEAVRGAMYVKAKPPSFRGPLTRGKVLWGVG